MRTGDGRVRCIGPQRWLVFRPFRRQSGGDRARSRPGGSRGDATRDVRDAGRDRTRDHRRGTSIATGRAAARFRSRRCRLHRERLHYELKDHRSWGFGVDDYRELTAAESKEMIGCLPNLGGSVHAALRSDSSREARARPGPSGRAGRRDDLREHRGGSDRVRPIANEPRHVRAEVVVRATEAFSAELPGPAPFDRAGLFVDDRDRTAPGRVLGRRPARRPARRSPTSGT